MDIERHLNTKISCSVENLRSFWIDWTDAQRIEVIKSIILLAPDCHGFYAKILKELTSEKFKDAID